MEAICGLLHSILRQSCSYMYVVTIQVAMSEYTMSPSYIISPIKRDSISLKLINLFTQLM